MKTVLIAAVAIAAAAAGTALAEPTAGTAVSKKKVKKIASNQIIKLAPELAVASADTAKNADTATRAQSAATANGVKPIKLNFTAQSNATRTVVNQGGIKITAVCGAGQTELQLLSTATNGVVKVDVANANTPPLISTLPSTDFDTGIELAISASSNPTHIVTATIAYRGASGTVVTGDVEIARATAAAQCVIAGTLFVG